MPPVQSKRHNFSEPINTTETKYLITEGFTFPEDHSIDCESTKMEETVTQKPFDPEPTTNNGKLFQTPNTPDDLVVSTTTTTCLSPSTASPATPCQQTISKIPSPWGSMVSLCLRDNDGEQALPTAPPAAAPGPAAPKPPPAPPVEQPKEAYAVNNAPVVSAPLTITQVSEETEHPRFTCIVASYSLTHNKDAIKTYRRMAIKTRDKKVQMAYAKYLLGVANLYEESSTTRKRLMEEGAYWIARLAKRKVWEAVFLQGQHYLDVRQTAKATRCFEKAAKNGWSPAYLALAAQAEVQGDWHKALACYRSADSHPEANYKMAMVLMSQNMSSIQVLEKAAEQGKSLESGKAALVLSHIYSHKIKTSDTVDKDDTRAFRYLKQAVQFNLAEAVCRMGQVYTYGLLKQPSDPWQGYQYFVKAAEEGYDLAMLELAKVYAKGIHGYLAQQPDTAFRWCQRAAERGLKDAEYTLGRKTLDNKYAFPKDIL
ncbi:hypothetical protein BJV82DRAFT_576369 [Fennellomyces sp. T-0311]|nr:hypothetical protein BJV82DRAFT_576369 [Fennellomyces sp. T-0311]